jgi:hypothetical protein
LRGVFRTGKRWPRRAKIGVPPAVPARDVWDRTNRRIDNLLQLAADPGAWAALAALSAMEVVLGIDNLVFNAPGVMVSNVYAGLASGFQQVQEINPTAGLHVNF